MKASPEFPEVWTLPWRQEGGHAIHVTFKHRMVLADVDVFLLQKVADRWTQRTKMPAAGGVFREVPRLVFEPQLGEQYDGKVVLCTVMKGGAKLHFIERLAVRRAFRFKRVKSEKLTFSTIQTLEVLSEQAVDAIREFDKSAFDKVVDEMIDLHATLLQLGEFNDGNGGPQNYAQLDAESGFSNVLDSWARAYFPIMEASIAALDRDAHYFGKCSYLASRIVRRIEGLPSRAGISGSVQAQANLWYRLSDWWSTQCGRQGLKHDAKNAARLLPPAGDLHLAAIRSFIAGWERVQSVISHSVKEDDLIQWRGIGPVYSDLARQLTDSMSYLAKSVWSGDVVSVEYWVDFLARWNTTARSIAQYKSRTGLLNDAQKMIIGPHLLELPWPDVEARLKTLSEYEHATFSQGDIVGRIIFNAWQDDLFILSDVLLTWAADTDAPELTLAIEAVRKLIQSELVDTSEPSGPSQFYSSFSDYIISTLRRGLNGAFAGDELRRQGLAEQLDRIAAQPMMPGRIYGGMVTIDETTERADFILGALRAVSEPDVLVRLRRHAQQWLADDVIAKHVEARLLEIQRSLSIERSEKWQVIFEHLREAISGGGESSGIQRRRPAGQIKSDNYDTQISAVRQTVMAIQSIVSDVRNARILSAPVSQARLTDIAGAISEGSFDHRHRQFPQSMFADVRNVDENLVATELKWNGYPKGALTEPPLDQTSFDYVFVADEVSRSLKERVIVDVVVEARRTKQLVTNSVTTERQYANRLLQLTKNLTVQGLTPIILTGWRGGVEWFDNWQTARWDPSIKLPKGIEIEQSDGSEPAHQFNLSGSAVYQVDVSLGGTLVFAKEILEALHFSVFENSYPVRVTFTDSDEKPWYGTLGIHWERRITLGPGKIYLIRHNTAAPE